MEHLKKDVQDKFDKLREAINLREKLLLRQIDAISSISIQTHNKNCVATGTNNINNNNVNPVVGNNNNGGGGVVDDIKFITENEESILGYLRQFGKFNLDKLNFANDLYLNEDYILPNIDHEIMYKQMPSSVVIDNSSSSSCSTSADENDNNEKIIVDFSNNKKLIKDNVDYINDSIISITLNETKELIKRTNLSPQPINLNLKNFKTSSSISTDSPTVINGKKLNSSSSSTSDKLQISKSSAQSHIDMRGENLKIKNRKSLKPKITINNCNGTINLKNISNLIINCASQEMLNVEKNLNNNNDDKSPTEDIDDSIAESQPIFSSITENDNEDGIENENNLSDDYVDDDDLATTTNSDTTMRTTTTTKNDEENCEFYNRLIREIKNTLKQQPNHKHTNNKSTTTENNNIPVDSTTTTTSTPTESQNGNNNSNMNRKFLLRNFENLKIILETTQNDNEPPQQRPVQIEQWLAEIISETEVEPMQNTEILETKNARNENILLYND